MSDNAETAILAGGCFWGVQELLRHRDGVISTRVGYTGGKNDNPTYRNHPGHAEAVEIVFDPERISSSSSSRSTIRRRRTARATTSALTTARRSSIRATSSARSPRTRSPTSTPRACGPARW
jgi:hypothetical protein